MSGLTTNEGITFPLTTDFADVQDFFRIAYKADALIRAYDTTFKASARKMAFCAKTTVNGTNFTTGAVNIFTDTVEWDTTRNGISGGSFNQPTDDVPSWWLFGGNVAVAIISGTPTVGDKVEAQIQVATIDPVSGVQTVTKMRSKRNETNTGGEQIPIIGAAKIYHATVTLAMSYYGSGTATIAPSSGCRFWGYRLGSAL